MELLKLVEDALKDNQLVQGGLVFGIIMGMLRYAKTWPVWIWTRIERLIVYRVTIEETDPFYSYFEIWLRSQHKEKYRNVLAGFNIHRNGDIERDKKEIGYRQFEDVFTIWKGIYFIRIFKVRQVLENASDVYNRHHESFQLISFSRKEIENILDEAKNYYETYKTKFYKEKVVTKVCDSYGYWETGKINIAKPLDEVIYSEKESLMSDINNFLNSYEFYKENYVTFKRGYCFSGPPGNGKTTIIQSIAKEIGFSCCYANLLEMNDEAVIRMFESIEPRSILIFEDIDRMFKSTGDAEKGSKVSMSTLLNCLDGSLSQDHIIVIFTTNHPETLNEALIREGRIDMKFDFPNGNLSDVYSYSKLKFNTQEDLVKLLALADKEFDIPMVSIQNCYFRAEGDVNKYIQNLLDYKPKNFSSVDNP